MLNPFSNDDPSWAEGSSNYNAYYLLYNEFGESVGNYYTDFTLDKKINSKKFIEQLSSVTPIIPRFDHTGNFKFDSITLGSS